MPIKSSALNLTFSDHLVVMTCPVCGIPYGMPADMQEAMYDYAGSWCCIRGCSLTYRKSDADRERERREQAERETTRVRAQLDQEKASHRGTKGHLTRARKREAAGVCPCCHRQFRQVEAHMKRMHPGFVDEHGS